MGKASPTVLSMTILALIFIGCGKSEPVSSPTVTVDPAKLQLFGTLPDVMASSTNPVTEEKVALGRMLYYETRLSRSHQISCNSCHMLDKYGVDGQPTSDGHKGRTGNRNSPTVYNAA
ncbi:MAG TPA: cytochrome-c peroxidase, partial [Acidobacteriota bacterium]|nr:cytochrome-c peroxidase [Acidobacteriota bacterium]